MATREDLLRRKRDLLLKRKAILEGSQMEVEPKKVTPFLPKLEQVQEKISERPGATEALREEMALPFSGGLLKKGVKAGVTGLKAATIPFRLGEAGLANVGLSVQKGEFNPIELAKEFGLGITGKKFGEFGDIIRTTGFGGQANELISNIAGFGALLGASNLVSGAKITKGARSIKNANIAKKKFFFKQQADKLAQGVDDVIGGVKNEFDNIYSKIGNNPIGQQSQGIVQDIVNRVPSNILNKIKTKAKVTGKPGIGEILETGEKVVLKPTIETAKKIKTEIGKSIPNKVWSGIDDATEVQAKLMDDYFKLNDIIAESAGELKPDLLSLNKKYKDLMGFNKVIKGITRKKSTGVTSTSIRGIKEPSMQGELAEIEQFSNQFLPKAMDIIKDVDRFNKVSKLKNTLATGAKYGIGFEAARRFGFNPLLKAVEDIGGGGGEYGGGFE